MKVAGDMDTKWADTAEEALAKLDMIWEADLTPVERPEEN
jgi:hypothetical protein